jgi:hypothetical protein
VIAVPTDACCPADRVDPGVPATGSAPGAAAAVSAAVNRSGRGGRGSEGGAQRGELLALGEPALLPPFAGDPLGLAVVAVPAADHPRAVQAGIEVEDLGADLVQEHPVVAGEHHGPWQLDQRRGQELGGLVVQVVGRLVQQHRTGPAHQHRREGEPAALAAGHLPGGSARLDLRQAEAGEHPLRTGVRVPDLGGLRPQQRVVVPGRGVRRIAGIGQRRRGGLQLGADRPHLRERGLDHLAERGVGAEGRLLVQVGEVGGAIYRAGVGVLRAGEQPEQRGLADPVLADDAEPVTRGDGHGEIGEHPAVAVRAGQADGAEHGRAGTVEERGDGHRGQADHHRPPRRHRPVGAARRRGSRDGTRGRSDPHGHDRTCAARRVSTGFPCGPADQSAASCR